MLPNLVELVVKANVELADKQFFQLSQHLLENVPIVLLGCLSENVASTRDDRAALLAELLQHGRGACQLQLLDRRLHVAVSFFFHLVAPVVGNHFSLAREVEFFLVADHSPRLVNEDGKTVNRDVLLAIRSALQEECLGRCTVKSVAQVSRFLRKRIWLEDLVRHHRKFKLEEVRWLRAFVLLGLVDLGPNLVQIFVDHGFDLLKGDPVVVVAKHEQ